MCSWQDGRKLLETKSGENRHNVRIMGEIEVDGLVQGKGSGVVIQSRVDLRPGIAQGVVLETSNYFLDVPNSNGAASRRGERVSPGKVKVD